MNKIKLKHKTFKTTKTQQRQVCSNKKTKWANFPYSGKETKKITNKDCIPNKKHNTKHTKTPPTNR
jgi:hypothetical protein